MANRVNFAPGIRKVNQLVNSSVNLNARALERISRILSKLNEVLIINCQRKFKPTMRNHVMGVSVAETIVRQLYGGRMQCLALAEGNRRVFQFHCGHLRYAPSRKAAMRVKAKEKCHGPVYSKGVSTLAKAAFPETSLQTRGRQLVCKMMGEISKKISDDAKAEAQASKCLEPTHIKTAVEHIMTEVIRRHAEAEGMRMISSLETGRIAFDPPKKRTTLKKVPAKKRKLVSKTRLSVSRPKVSRTGRPKSVAAKRKGKTPARKRKVARKAERPVSRGRKRPLSKTRSRKMTVSRESKRKRLVSTKKKSTVSGVRKKPVSRAKKRPVSKTTGRKRTVSSERKRKRLASTKKKSTVSRKRKKPVSGPSPKQKKVARKKRATSPKVVRRPRTSSRKRKPSRKVGRKQKVTPQKKSKSARKMKAGRKVKKSAQKRRIPGLSSLAMEDGARKLNAKCNKQSIDLAAVQLIAMKLRELACTISRETSNNSSPNIGAREVRQAVLNVLPSELQGLAIARICQVVTNV